MIAELGFEIEQRSEPAEAVAAGVSCSEKAPGASRAGHGSGVC